MRPNLCLWHSEALILHRRACSEGMAEVLHFLRQLRLSVVQKSKFKQSMSSPTFKASTESRKSGCPS